MKKYQISNIKYQNYISKYKNFKFCIVILIFAFCILNFLGCATYKFQRGKPPCDKGYVVSRDVYTILEYTVGKDYNVPNLKLAKERFNRRKKVVEHYYKKMGYIENHFKMAFWDPCIMSVKFIGGMLRLPFVAISDYRYEHNPKYRERIRKLGEEIERRQEARIKKFKDELNIYIQKDLASETEETKAEALKETLTRIEQEIARVKQPQKEELFQPKEERLAISIEEKPKIPVEEKVESSQIQHINSSLKASVAIIIAKPAKGFSPLRVHFYGYKSHSPHGKIVSYLWDFGDGDTSTKVNPVNTYYSGTSAPQYFTATLTVQDDKGNTAKATTTIEVLNR